MRREDDEERARLWVAFLQGLQNGFAWVTWPMPVLHWISRNIRRLAGAHQERKK
jgi:hypothetical protein